MSGSLSRLRHYFDDGLLVPVGRQMMLTPVAEGLVEPVRDILLRIRGTLGSRPQFDPSTATRHFSVAVSDYVTEILIADVLRRARREAPGITFELRPVGRRANEDLNSGELDFLISPEAYLSPRQPTEVLFEDTFTCVVWTGKRSIGTSLTIDECAPSTTFAGRSNCRRALVLGEGVPKLLGGPRCGWMIGHRHVHDPSPVVSQQDEHEEQPERDGWDNEEVGRRDRVGVVREERAPGL